MSGTAADSDPTPLRISTLGPRDWPRVVELFGSRGACGGCWCMWWRVPRGGKDWNALAGRKARNRFRRLVQEGHVHAVLAFSGTKPVGWCSYGPAESFPRFESARSLKRRRRPGTWSIVCFYIATGWRGRGVATALLHAATEEAFAAGASEIEAFPAVPYEAGKRMPAAFAYTGVPELYRRAGFRKLRRPKETRPIYVKTARP